MARARKKAEGAEACVEQEAAVEDVRELSGALTREERRRQHPAGAREYMRRRLAREFPQIVSGFVEAAKTGSCPHMKLAAELLKPTRKAVTRRKGAAQLFLEKLEKERREKQGVVGKE